MSSLEKFYEQQIATAMKVIVSNPEWIQFMRDFNDPDGFCFSQSSVLMDLETHILAADNNHTGTSFAYVMRRCQKILSEPSVENVLGKNALGIMLMELREKAM